MNLKTRIINRLWKGYASLRDYEVKEAISSGGVILKLKYTEEIMTLFPKDLAQGTKSIQVNYPSKFNQMKTYSLIDFKWRPDKINENQTKIDL